MKLGYPHFMAIYDRVLWAGTAKGGHCFPRPTAAGALTSYAGVFSDDSRCISTTDYSGRSTPYDDRSHRGLVRRDMGLVV